jgi:hypothetical protein
VDAPPDWEEPERPMPTESATEAEPTTVKKTAARPQKTEG